MTKKIETFHQHRWLAEAEISLINEQIFTFFALEFHDKIALADYFSLVQKLFFSVNILFGIFFGGWRNSKNWRANGM